VIAAIDGSRTTAAIGLIAEPTVRSTGAPTGTEAVSGVTTIGGGVGLGAAVATGVAAGVGEGEGDGDGV
jgi:hypothetical protein